MVAVTQRVSTDPEGNQGSPETLLIRNGHITAAPAHDDHQVPDGAPIDRAHTAAAHSDRSHADGSHTDGSHTDGANQQATEDVIFELHHLRRRLETLPVIEQSKGILIGPTASMLIPRSTCCAVGRP